MHTIPLSAKTHKSHRMLKYIFQTHHTTTTITTVLRPFFQDYLGEPVPEENFWTLSHKGRLTEEDTSIMQLGATPSGLTSAHLHHPIFYRPDALPATQPTVSKHWRQLAHSDEGEDARVVILFFFVFFSGLKLCIYLEAQTNISILARITQSNTS